MKKTTFLTLLLSPLFFFAQVTNGTFDTDINGWVGQNSPASMTWSSTEGHDAPGAIRVVASGATNSGIKSDPASATAEGLGNYIFSAWVKGTAGDKVQLFVFQGSSMNAPQYTLTSNNWEFVTATFNSLDGTTNTTVRVVGRTAGMTFYVDDITFVKEPCSGYAVTASDNFAGTNTITTPLGCYTTGTMVEFTATPSCAEFVFDHWEINTVPAGTTNPLSFTVGTEDADVKAVFTAVNTTVDRNFDTDAELNEWTAATDASLAVAGNDMVWTITGGASKIAYNSCAFAPTSWNYNGMRIGYTNNSANTRLRLKYAKTDGGFEYVNFDGLTTDNTPQVMVMPLTLATWTDYLPNLEILMRADDLNNPSTAGTFTIDYIEFYYDAALSTAGFDGVKNASVLYPNPAKNFISIESNQVLDGIVIYNLNGQKMSATSATNQVDVSNLQAGIYFIQLMQNNTALEVLKFVKL